MQRRLILALMLMGCGSAAAQATVDFPYGPSHVFAAFRNGERIGTHTLTFQQSGDKKIVTTSIDFSVKALGLTMYRYVHRGQEVWNGNTFESISTQTDDNGTKYEVKARHDANGVSVLREGSAPKLATNDVGFQQGNARQTTMPPSTLPSTHWNLKQVKQTAMLNSQNGDLAKVQITSRGREAVKTASGNTLQATRYSYSGDVQMDQWFDDRGRWVKAAFKASDGSTIEYILQE